MRKKIMMILLVTLMTGMLSGCQSEPVYEKYSATFFDTFDTIIQVVGYTQTEEEFNDYMTYIENRMAELHKLFDKYQTYEGINNIKTINDHAGIKPVKVDEEIIDLIQFSKEWYEQTQGKTNIALGTVTNIWSEYREAAKDNPGQAQIPPMDLLKSADEYTDIHKVIVDVENNTVFLEDSSMILDVGAVAKGFATEIIAQEVEEKGFNSLIISAGGNIRTVGKPLDGIRDRWGVGIQNPDRFVLDNTENLETIFINDASVVTSGDYQRYYVVGDERIHHLIDPDTLMPGSYYRSATVVTEDSGLADYLSTAVFLLPFEESKALVESLDGVEALWVLEDGKIEFTEGLKKSMKSQGASGAD